MSFEIKNIEQENLNLKKLTPVALFSIIAIIASSIFVYYWFTLETRKIMYDQYLGKESSRKLKFDKNEAEKFNNLNIESAKKEVENYYMKK